MKYMSASGGAARVKVPGKVLDAASILLLRRPVLSSGARPTATPGCVVLSGCSDCILDCRILLVKRHPKARFFPNCYVFPGGVLESTDDDAATVIKQHLGKGGMEQLPEAPQFAAAAVRELWEETGILLQHGSIGGRQALTASSVPSSERAGRDFYALEGPKGAERGQRVGPLTASMLSRRVLLPFAHLVTPIGQPFRYNTQFYAAVLDNSDDHSLEVSPEEAEVTRASWVTVREALLLHRGPDPDFVLSHPTAMLFYRLAVLGSVTNLVAHCSSGTPPRLQMQRARSFEIDGVKVNWYPTGAVHFLDDGIHVDVTNGKVTINLVGGPNPDEIKSGALAESEQKNLKLLVKAAAKIKRGDHNQIDAQLAGGAKVVQFDVLQQTSRGTPDGERSKL